MNKLLHRSAVKATRQIGQTLESVPVQGMGTRWMGSRRAFLKVYDDALVCRDWTIPHAAIKAAELVAIPYYFTRGYLLRVQTDEGLYEFGLSPSRFWRGDIPFAAKRSKASGPTFVVGQVVRFLALAWLQTCPFIGIPFLLYVLWLHIR